MMSKKINEKLDVFGGYLLSQTQWCGEFELPYVDCYLEDFPDYLAVYTEKRNYKKTPNTAVCYCVYDYKFDKSNNLYDAIVFKRNGQLEKYRERFAGVKYICAPDYSTYFNMPIYMQMANIAKSRVVCLWLKHECGIPAIPCASFGYEGTFDWCHDGIGEGSDVFLGLKGAQKEKEGKARCQAGVKNLVNKVQPRSIIVYSTASDDVTMDQLDYAVSKGVRIIIPENHMKNRNRILREVK